VRVSPGLLVSRALRPALSDDLGVSPREFRISALRSWTNFGARAGKTPCASRPILQHLRAATPPARRKLRSLCRSAIC